LAAPTVLPQLFDRVVTTWPDRIAIDVPPCSTRPDRRTVTYKELKRQSDALARSLTPLITAPECIVVILLPRSSEYLYIAQLAVLRAGGAFTCLDVSFPDHQLKTIVTDASAAAILTDPIGVSRINHLGVRTPVIDVADSLAAAGPDATAPEPTWLSDSSLAYLIYTSGTTGRPKGVMIEHRSIVNLVRGDLDTLGVTPDDRVAQHSSPAYDSSIEETWFAFAAGATLVVMDDETARLGPDLPSWLRRERITMFCPAPTMLRAMGSLDPRRELPDLRLLHPGGEALAQDIADKWAPGRTVINDYGPTETTVTALRGRVEAGAPVSIGRPVPGVQAWVLDESLEEVPDGAPGELCIGGLGLARGYHNDPGMTARKFPVHSKLGRIYRTGDLARREADGRFFCLGRIDAQVKVRGYRIELEAIEARLVECAGVREAACAVQGQDTAAAVAAFIVAESSARPPAFDDLARILGSVLPPYMVPVQFDLIDRLPRTTSGKLNRQALPQLTRHAHEHGDAVDPSRTPLEELIGAATRRALQIDDTISIHDDFFTALGGNSLSAAVLISLLREYPQTSLLAVRDVYEARTTAALAARTQDTSHAALEQTRQASESVAVRPAAATCIQVLWLILALAITAPATFAIAFWILPALLEELGTTRLLLLAPVIYVAGLIAYGFVTILLAVVSKTLLIGTYRPQRVPVWSGFYARNWVVQRMVRLIPWRLLEITELQNVVLRALGARIGKRVHLHRGVNLTQGGWDLLEVGDEVTVGQDVALQIVALEDGHLVFDHVSLESGATLEVRAGVGGNTRVGAGAVLTAWSFLPHGGRVPARERWDGVPAHPAGGAEAAQDAPRNRDLTPGLHAMAMILGRLLLSAFVAMPVLALLLASDAGLRATGESEADWLFLSTHNARAMLLDGVLVAAAMPLVLLFQAVAMQMMGRSRPGCVSRWGLEYVRVRLKTDTLESAGRWLCGTLLWPVWLRMAGMRIGRQCEISTIIDTLPELVEIGDETFFADGIYLAGPHITRGTVTLARVRLGARVFIGNHAVIGCGQSIPDDVLLGVCTVADDRIIRRGTSWFGHPPFELHQRETVTADRRLTHDPTWLRYINRVVWEQMRFAIPLVPLLIGLVWVRAVLSAAAVTPTTLLLFGALPAFEGAALAAAVLCVVALKWMLLGRVQPGTHPLWSCWCSRWDFLYVAWDVLASALLSVLDGSLLLNALLRLMGVRLGRDVVLGPGFAHVADPDMLAFEDRATLTPLLQAHTFEDRVLKIDHLTVRREATVGNGALILYGADIGAGASVMSHSVIMKRERLLPGYAYAGCPTRPVGLAQKL
jgi:non-ribosomal peptide synthetase-like protein